MKKWIVIVLALLLVCGLAGCGKAEEAACYIAAEDVTLDTLMELTTPEKVLERVGGMRIDYDYDGTGDPELDEGTIYRVYVKEGDTIHCNLFEDYPDGTFNHYYFTNDPADPMLYVESESGKNAYDFSNEERDGELCESFLGYDYFPEAKIVSAEVDGDHYLLTVEAPQEGVLYFRDTLTMEAATGFVTEITEEYFENGEAAVVARYALTYSNDLTSDPAPKEGAEVPEQAPAGNVLTFSTTDINGKPVTEEILRGAKLVLVNFWEPWCGPCVEEMPELQELYEAYKDQGLLILGVFATTDETEEAKEILETIGTTYPILICDANLARYQTAYVPTTIFTDGEGRVLSDEPVIGAKDYAAWEALVQEYLK